MQLLRFLAIPRIMRQHGAVPSILATMTGTHEIDVRNDLSALIGLEPLGACAITAQMLTCAAIVLR